MRAAPTFRRTTRSGWQTTTVEAIFEVAPRTGKLKRVIREDAFRSTRRFGGGPRAGPNRTGDFESMAYDAANDVLYVFSGKCCTGTIRPTVFRLTRRRGVLELDSWQPLGRTSDFTAAGWNSADHRLYVAVGSDLQTYDYPSNALGQPFQITDLTGIFGLSFSRDGSEMYAVTNGEVLYAVDWQSQTIIPGWSFDLTPFGVLDSRAVERIGGRFFVLDGALGLAMTAWSSPCSNSTSSDESTHHIQCQQFSDVAPEPAPHGEPSSTARQVLAEATYLGAATADMCQSRGAAAELDGQASHQSDGLAPTSKRRMQRRSPRPADAELTLLELCASPLSYLPGRSCRATPSPHTPYRPRRRRRTVGRPPSDPRPRRETAPRSCPGGPNPTPQGR